MQAITVFRGTTIPMMKDNIDTDQIIPKQFLKNIRKTGYGRNLFYAWRYTAPNRPDPSFILNAPAYAGATVLVAGKNFGCGSSREHAVWALRDYGFKAVIAGGFSDIFYMNSTKNGLLPIVLSESERDILAALAPDESIEIDLPNQVVRCGDREFVFEIEPVWKHKFVNGLDDIDITLDYADAITAYEARIPEYRQGVTVA